MKALRQILSFSVFVVGIALVLPGCYTQLATSESDNRSEYGQQRSGQEYTYDENDSLSREQPYDEQWYPYYRYRFGFRYYDPYYYGYDPWFYDYYPWYGSSFYFYPYSYYRGFATYYPYYGYFDPYRSYYGYPYVVYGASSSQTRTRDSGYRRSGYSRGRYDYRTSTGGAGFNIAPAARTSTSRDAGNTRSGSYAPTNRNSDASSGRSMWRGRPTNDTRSGGDSRGRGTVAPSGRTESGGSRQSSGSTPTHRGRDYNNNSGSSTPRHDSYTPSRGSAPSYTPAPSTHSSAPASSGGSSSGGNRSSGASRSGRGH